MYNNLLKQSSPLMEFAFSLFFIMVGLLLFFFIGTVIAIPLFGIDFNRVNEYMDATRPENLATAKYFQMVSAIGMFVVPALIMGFLYGKPLTYLRLNSQTSGYLLLLSLFITILALPFINWLAWLNSEMSLPDFLSGVEQWMRESENKAKHLTEAFLKTPDTSELLYTLFVVALVPAVGEELLFRGVFQPIFIRLGRNIHIGIWVTAIVFSAFHVQFYGFFPRMLLGAFLGYILVWSGSMWTAIVAHFVNNATVIILFHLYNNQIIAQNIDDVGVTVQTMYLAFVSLLLCSVLLWHFYRHSRLTHLSTAQFFQMKEGI